MFLFALVCVSQVDSFANKTHRTVSIVDRLFADMEVEADELQPPFILAEKANYPDDL